MLLPPWLPLVILPQPGSLWPLAVGQLLLQNMQDMRAASPAVALARPCCPPGQLIACAYGMMQPS